MHHNYDTALPLLLQPYHQTVAVPTREMTIHIEGMYTAMT